MEYPVCTPATVSKAFKRRQPRQAGTSVANSLHLVLVTSGIEALARFMISPHRSRFEGSEGGSGPVAATSVCNNNNNIRSSGLHVWTMEKESRGKSRLSQLSFFSPCLSTKSKVIIEENRLASRHNYVQERKKISPKITKTEEVGKKIKDRKISKKKISK